MYQTLDQTVPQVDGVVDIEPGDFWLPTIRRYTPAGQGPAVAIAEASDDDVSSAILETLKFRRTVLEAITEQLNTLSSEQLRRLNGAA